MRTKLTAVDKKGSALIVVMWIVGLLSLMVASMTFDAHLEAKIATYSRKKVKAEYLATAGMQISKMLMKKMDTAKAEKKDDEIQDDRWYEPAHRLAQGLNVEGLVEKIGEGEVTITIKPEPAKRNVNFLIDEDWERIFEESGVPEEMWPGLIESVLDWLDVDNAKRRDGAETDDYYLTLETPYKAKNGPMDDVGELLLVKGFNRTILEGGMLKRSENDTEPLNLKNIKEMLTVYGDGKVNINAASKRVLMTLPDVDEIVAGAIIEEREGLDKKTKEQDTSFKSIDDLFGRVPGLDPKLRNLVSTDSKIFEITCVGKVGSVERKNSCIGQYANKDFKILKWWESD